MFQKEQFQKEQFQKEQFQKEQFLKEQFLKEHDFSPKIWISIYRAILRVFHP